LIQLKNVTKIYPNGTMALKNISVDINKGEFVFVVGTSGSGKSSFIKLLLKEIEPTEGTIVVNSNSLNDLKRNQIPYHRRQIGVVFQDFRLLENKTVYDNVAFAMQIVESPVRDIRRNVPMVLSLVGLSKKAKVFPHELSGGEKQRVALARAIVNNPFLLIADEPTGNLDPETSWEIMKLLNDINHRGTTVIVATHEKEIVNGMKKRVLEIKNGELVRDILKGGYNHEA